MPVRSSCGDGLLDQDHQASATHTPQGNACVRRTMTFGDIAVTS